ncbi:TetR/AcrR family transcriptional regulator [Vallitalea maricola]|uniref:TetR/AcrR family transcriptional regulator n=1 Tax=Vallitalea maricola TaxID=3074433 RepID=A0ACB5UGN1_9FIRM|nr:TetR/AcrR family transcriptional regulator [Vallitalea sp. AN17-2]
MDNIKKRDAELSRKKILDAAETLFAQKGYHLTTLTEIAELSGLSRTTPSYFFGNKEMLYKKVIEHLIEDEKNYVDKLVIEDKVTVEALKTILARHIDYTFKHPNLTKILVTESLNKNRQEWILSFFPDMISWSHKYLSDAKEMGIIRQDIDINTLWLNAMAMAWLPIITQDTFLKLMDKDFTRQEFIDNHKKQVETLIFESILA